MCNGSHLGQWNDNKPYAIYYVSQSLDDAQMKYATTEKEFLVVVFALEKFHPYLINSKVIINFHWSCPIKAFLEEVRLQAPSYSLGASSSRIWLGVRDNASRANVVADHLSHLGAKATPTKKLPKDDSFPDDQLLAISYQTTPWYADLVNFKVCGVMPHGLSYQQKKKFLSDVKYVAQE